MRLNYYYNFKNTIRFFMDIEGLDFTHVEQNKSSWTVPFKFRIKKDDKNFRTLQIPNIYNFKLSNSYISYNGKQAEHNNTYNYLQRLTKKYKNRNFYKIKYVKDLKEENNEIISLDRTSNYIVINFNKKVTNFKINQISSDGDKFSDIDLLYSKDSVNDEVVIRKSIGYQSPDIRISFTNEYGFRFSIIPQHNNDKLEFLTEVKKEI